MKGSGIYLQRYVSGYILLIAMLLNVSCKKHERPFQTPVVPTPEPETDIYVSGNLYTGHVSKAVYWKNDTLISLATNNNITSSSANAMFVSGTDVFVAGSVQINGKSKAVYWKNRNIVVLDDGSATDIVVKNSDVYVSGHFDSYFYSIYALPVKVAAYWKNGVITKLKNPIEELCCGIPDAEALSIAVSGNDVYLGGYGNGNYAGGNYAGIFWKNDIATNLTHYFSGFGNLCAKSSVNDIVIHDADVYMAGYIMPATGLLANSSDIGGALYWKNTVGFQIFSKSINSVSNAIAVNGSTLYTAGTDDMDNAYYKKNDNLFTLRIGGQRPAVTGIAIYHEDVYVSGYSRTATTNSGIAGYWKNGNLTTLSSNAQTTGIVVVKHR